MGLSKEEIRARRLTPLMIASAEGDLTLVRELISISIVDETDSRGSTALMYAALNKNLDIIRELIAAGANPLHKNSNGLSAYAIAQNNQWTSVVSALAVESRTFEAQRLHTHYDNLKVTQDAPIEVIRAAYKGLAQKYHPDKNDGDPNAARITSILNTAYEVLSDPEKRKLHDEWIAQQRNAPNTNPSRQKENTTTKSGIASSNWWQRNWHYTALGLFAILLTYGALQSGSRPNRYVPAETVATSAKQQAPIPAPAPVRQINMSSPEAAIARQSADSSASKYRGITGYLPGFQQIYANALCAVTVDNSKNETDVLVKLFSLDVTPAVAIRTFAIRAGEQFTAHKVSGGRYDVRYKDLQSGEYSKSEAFDLEVLQDQDGTRYSTITMTLYKVRNGNMQTSRIPATEFEE